MGHYELVDKVVFVTGSSRGIGLGIARRFGEEGCKVAINGVDRERLHAAAEQLESVAEELLVLQGDVSDPSLVTDMFEQIARRFGGVDILVNNAARVTKRRWLPEIELAFFDEVQRVNVRSVFLCSRAAAVQMARRGGGAIINLSSVGGNRSFRGSTPYVTSKGAIEALTRALAMDLASYRIRVNAIGPGSIWTEAWEGLPQNEIERRRSVVPLQREGFPADIAGTAAFLASTDASYITGQVIYVDGGMLTQCYSPCAELNIYIDAPPEHFELME